MASQETIFHFSFDIFHVSFENEHLAEPFSYRWKMKMKMTNGK